MSDAFLLIFRFWQSLFNLLNGAVFDIGGFEVSLGGLIIAFLILGMVISVFWKGGQA